MTSALSAIGRSAVLVRTVALCLGCDLRVFLDARSLKAGDFWDLEIPNALRASRVVVILVSASYQGAHYLRAEVVEAIERARRGGVPRVVPIYLDGPLPDDAPKPYGLGTVQSIDAHAEGGLEAVSALLADLALQAG